jgi:uncharacterized protein (DUF2384 family)
MAPSARQIQEGSPDTAQRRQAEVLAKAVRNAAERLQLSQAQLGRILGLSKASVSRMGQGAFPLPPTSKAGELGLLLVRLYRSLDSIVGTDAAARAWLAGRHHALNARPLDLLQTIPGLVRVVDYLDAQRARI